MTPIVRLTDRQFHYIPAVATDVRRTWAKYAPEVVAKMQPFAPASSATVTTHIKPESAK
jgi:hypothetical protein